jgi:hypothetical protein
LGYYKPLKNNWDFLIIGSLLLSSNLKSQIKSNDFQYYGYVIFEKSYIGENTSRLAVGIMYNNILGRPLPLPYISYYRKFSPYFNFSIGLSDTNFIYSPNHKSKLILSLTVDGYFSNTGQVPIQNDVNSTTILTSAIGLGLTFQRKITKTLEGYASLGYIVQNSVVLLDKENNEVFNFDIKNAPLFQLGMKIPIPD